MNRGFRGPNDGLELERARARKAKPRYAFVIALVVGVTVISAYYGYTAYRDRARERSSDEAVDRRQRNDIYTVNIAWRKLSLNRCGNPCLPNVPFRRD